MTATLSPPSAAQIEAAARELAQAKQRWYAVVHANLVAAASVPANPTPEPPSAAIVGMVGRPTEYAAYVQWWHKKRGLQPSEQPAPVAQGGAVEVLRELEWSCTDRIWPPGSPTCPICGGHKPTNLLDKNESYWADHPDIDSWGHDDDCHLAIALAASSPDAATADRAAGLEAEVANAEAVCNSYALENQQFHDRFTVAEAAVATLTARIATLEEALRPFAEDAQNFEKCTDHRPMWLAYWSGFSRRQHHKAVIGDLRRARTALSTTDEAAS